MHLEIEISMNKLPKALANPKNSYVIDLHSLLGLSFFASYGANFESFVPKICPLQRRDFWQNRGPYVKNWIPFEYSFGFARLEGLDLFKNVNKRL